jgi:hypothetical protein
VSPFFSYGSPYTRLTLTASRAPEINSLTSMMPPSSTNAS